MTPVEMQLDTPSPIRIFLVDDHPTILWGLERLIETATPPMTVVGQATSREQLLAQLGAAEPDVVLLDLDLNGKSSLDALPEIGQLSKARVLILTGNSDPLIHQQAIMQGALGVVHKQEDADIVLRAIDKIHKGEIWLDRGAIGTIVSALSRTQKPDPESARIAALTPKERRIVAAVVTEKGARNKVIAAKLHMSEHTLRNHLTAIYSKLQVASRLQLYLYATSHRLLNGQPIAGSQNCQNFV
jgi:two-component system nitrate/nitrite response regulator NarL